MPIDFLCSECQNLLRTPDDSAGKKAKCPRCGRVQDVPHRGSDLQNNVLSAHDAEEDASTADDASRVQGDNPFRELDALPAEEGAWSDNPYASPTAAGSVKIGYNDNAATREGLPWESQGYSVRTFWDTAKLVLGSSTPAFQTMHREGRLAAPILFMLGGGLIGYLLAAVFASVLMVGMLGLGAAVGDGGGGGGFALAALFQVVLQFVGALMYGTIGVAILWLITGSLAHLTLVLLGESQCEFETTLRVGGYALGATALLNAIPLCGGLFFWVMAVVVYILGLSAAHGISQGKAAAAVLAPFAVCCMGLLGIGGVAGYYFAQTM